jgi:3-oxoacyl-(acyl-carrier-protein) synthase
MLAGETAIKASPWAREVQGREAWQATVEDFNPGDWMDRRVEDDTDLFAQFTLAVADQAVRQANKGELDPLRAVVVNGTSIGGIRVVTLFSGSDVPISLITLFSENTKANIGKSERNELSSLGKLNVAEYTKRNPE